MIGDKLARENSDQLLYMTLDKILIKAYLIGDLLLLTTMGHQYHISSAAQSFRQQSIQFVW
jgi:hypothetical protein